SLSAAGYEADDIIATLATRGLAEGMEVLIASGDRDTFQLVGDDCTVLYPGKSLSDLVRMTPEAVEAKYAVRPERYRDLAALVGEKADNLPGVPGVGPKTAAKWLAKYGSLDELVARADEIGGKAGQNFRDHLDDVLRNQRLNRLDTEVEVGVEVGDMTLDGWNRDGVNLLFDNLEFASTLRDRLFAVLGESTSAEDAEAEPDEGFAVELVEVAPGALGEWLAAEVAAGARTGLAVEGTWERGGGDVVRLALAVPSGRAVCLDPARLDP